jgi:hypothetical protein
MLLPTLWRKTPTADPLAGLTSQELPSEQSGEKD